MTFNTLLPTTQPSDLMTFTLISDGQEVNGLYEISSITVRKEVNSIPTAKLVLLDGSIPDQDFEASAGEDFVPGKEIEVLVGYHSEENSIFKGIIVRHGIKIRAGRDSILTIECKDIVTKLTVGRKNAYYSESKDSDVMEEILAKYGIAAEVEATETLHQELVQYNVSDWDFLVSRAELNGKLVFVNDGEVSIALPDYFQDPVMDVVYGISLMEFEGEMDVRHQYPAVKAISWDYATQSIIEEEGADPGAETPGNLSSESLAEVIGLDNYTLWHSGQVKDQELKAWADAKMLLSRLAKIRGHAKIQGTAALIPGTLIELQGIGDRFNGKAYVSGVTHEIGKGDWLTSVQLGLCPDWFSQKHKILDTAATGLIPAIGGLQIGIVTQLESDPEGEDRVLVRMPIIDPQSEGIWARIASLDAGENRGLFFRPEIGDEVVLGFLNEDPRDPIILGMLNSSAKPAPITAADDNHEKGYVSRSELKLLFDDDKKSIVIETPSGKKISIDEDANHIQLEDENGNQFVMDSSGVCIDSSGDIKLKASGKIEIESGMDLNLKAGTNFKAEGAAGAELSTNAVAILKGSLVQIN